MTHDKRNYLQISTVGPDRLHDLYALAAGALRFDLFSPSLLEEKLFANPRPLGTIQGTDVSRFGAGEKYDVLVAACGGDVVGMMQVVTRDWQQRGWVGLFATAEDHRRTGIASRLLEAALEIFRSANVKTIDVLGIPGNYFAPGLDPRYTAALCFLEKNGFERFGDCANLVADLTNAFDTAAEEHRLRDAGVEIRRARADDAAHFDAFFAEQFGAEWRFECELAMRNDPPAVHLAVQAGRIIAFSAHSSQNREWGFFGPMGTAEAARKLSCGRVLLWRCLNDLRDAGHMTSIIPWVGPIGFYAKYVPCRVERVFWRYRKTL